MTDILSGQKRSSGFYISDKGDKEILLIIQRS